MNFLTPYAHLFLGSSPQYYKKLILAFLIANPLLYYFILPLMVDSAGFAMGWILLMQFIVTLIFALKCYPLQSGGILALQAVIMGLTSPNSVFNEIIVNIQVILLLVFMVAAIYFLRDLLFFIFANAKLYRLNRYIVAVGMLILTAILSAFLDALTVTAVLIAVFLGIYKMINANASIDAAGKEKINAYFRKLVMYGLIGTACGGVATLVGEPQNILIGEKVGWDFATFLIKIAPSTIICGISAIILTIVLENRSWLGYEGRVNADFLGVIDDFALEQKANATPETKAALIVQAICAILLCVSLIFHVAEVGIIGLMILILATAFGGKSEEHDMGPAFHEALPFTALLTVFFAIIAVIHDQHLFMPVIELLLSLPYDEAVLRTFMSTGVLSAVSDNVFVGGVYISAYEEALNNNLLTPEQYDMMGKAIVVGTNMPSVATPNGQAAFLFMLTSAFAPLIGLSYFRMFLMALPYTIVLTISALISIWIQL